MHFCQIHKMHALLPNPQNALSILIVNGTEIPITYQYKFLGITVNSKLSFIPYIKQLMIKCNQTIHLLRTVAHTDWDANKKP